MRLVVCTKFRPYQALRADQLVQPEKRREREREREKKREREKERKREREKERKREMKFDIF